MTVELDILTFGPHPDDCEIGTGAFLVKMKKLGYKTGFIALTEGDMGKGTPEIRRKETENAAKILRVDVVNIYNMGDCRLEDNFENRVAVAGIIRKYRPKLILAPYFGIEPGRGRGHADHIACGHLVTHAANFAHLQKFPAEGEPHSIKKILYYYVSPHERSTFIVSVDDELPVAEQAIAQHKSQFGQNKSKRKAPRFLEIYGRYYGALIGTKYGQPFYAPDTLRLDDPFFFFVKSRENKKATKKK